MDGNSLLTISQNTIEELAKEQGIDGPQSVDALFGALRELFDGDTPQPIEGADCMKGKQMDTEKIKIGKVGSKRWKCRVCERIFDAWEKLDATDEDEAAMKFGPRCIECAKTGHADGGLAEGDLQPTHEVRLHVDEDMYKLIRDGNFEGISIGPGAIGTFGGQKFQIAGIIPLDGNSEINVDDAQHIIKLFNRIIDENHQLKRKLSILHGENKDLSEATGRYGRKLMELEWVLESYRSEYHGEARNMFDDLSTFVLEEDTAAWEDVQARMVNNIGVCDLIKQRVRELKKDRDMLSGQIDELAKTIVQSTPGEPSRSEGAVECAQRLITQMRDFSNEVKEWQRPIETVLQRLSAFIKNTFHTLPRMELPTDVESLPQIEALVETTINLLRGYDKLLTNKCDIFHSMKRELVNPFGVAGPLIIEEGGKPVFMRTVNSYRSTKDMEIHQRLPIEAGTRFHLVYEWSPKQIEVNIVDDGEDEE